ncbi:MAG TPA: cytochrome c biogenesis protein CcsA [Methanomassiliicoccales archaeon]|jgi:cytochrome c-type biogenesis protein CcmF
MGLGDMLLILGAALMVASALCGIAKLYLKADRLSRIFDLTLVLSFIAFTLSMFYLIYAFLMTDTSLAYVWSNSSTDLDVVYKLSAIWSGPPGSFLLLTWLMSLVIVLELLRERRAKSDAVVFSIRLRLIAISVTAIFAIVLLTVNLFASSDPSLVALYPNGQGMVLSLQTPEMAIHPILVFAAYALLMVVFAAALSNQLGKDEGWTRIALSWARPAWLLLTLGIVIGAVWAYYVIGWGGYWGWDPVETSSLLAWLMATALVHVLLRNLTGKQYPVVAAPLAMITFSSALLVTFITRAGGIWAASVHSFGTGAVTSAPERLSAALQKDAVVAVTFAVLMMIFLAGLYFLYRNYRAVPRSDEEEGELFTDRSLMTLAVVIMVLAAAVILLIMVKNVDMTMSSNFAEFNQKMSFFIAAILIAMSLCLIHRWVKGRWMTWLAVGLVVSSIVLGTVMSLFGYGLEIGLVVPSALTAIAISVERIMRSGVPGSLRKTLYRAGPQVMHFGVALMLLTFVVSNNAQSLPASGEFNKVPIGGSVGVGGYTVTVTGIDIVNVTGVAGQRYDQVREATVDLYRSGQLIQGGVVLKAMYLSLFGDLGKVDVMVFVYSASLEDIYLTYDWVDNSTANIQMKEIPLMSFLWTGAGLLAVGMAMRFFAAGRAPTEQ